jgi:hypothetical protein
MADKISQSGKDIIKSRMMKCVSGRLEVQPKFYWGNLMEKRQNGICKSR